MKPVALDIHLDTPVAYLHPDEEDGHLVSGAIDLSLKTSTKILSLDITLFGQQIISYQPKTHVPIHKLSAAGTILRNKCLVDTTHPLISESQVLEPGTHQLPFEFQLDSQLPTTSRLWCGGHISYALRAHLRLQTSGLRRRAIYNAEKPLVVVRCPPRDMTGWQYMDTLTVSAGWEEQITIELNHPICAMSDGGRTEFQVTVTPTAKQFALMALDLSLKETQHVVADLQHELPAHKEFLMVARSKRMAFGVDGKILVGQEDFVVGLELPVAINGGIQYDISDTSDIHISHYLTLVALIKTPDNQTIEMTLPARVQVLPSLFIEDTTTALPRYADIKSDKLLLGSTSLPSYSLPVCKTCGKEDISVLQCRKAIVSQERRPKPNADIEDLCLLNV